MPDQIPLEAIPTDELIRILRNVLEKGKLVSCLNTDGSIYETTYFMSVTLFDELIRRQDSITE